MICSRVWAMPSKWTFTVPPLRQIIDRYKSADQTWIDPFAGQNSPCEITNDMNPAHPADFHLDAHDLVDEWGDVLVDGAIFDPPYSLTQVARSYNDIGLEFKGKENPTGGYPKVKAWLGRIVKPGGYVISYGWNSCGMGKKNGFEIIEVLLCCHGGNHNDTIVTVERKLWKL